MHTLEDREDAASVAMALTEQLAAGR